MKAVHTALVMVGGMGTRMRRQSGSDQLSPAQRTAAAAGLKGMIPDLRGRPFLDHLLTNLSRGGIQRVVLVVAPDYQILQEYFQRHPLTRLRLDWAIQPVPNGTAGAVLAAESVLGGEDFLVCNGDNLYPSEEINALTCGTGWALMAFSGQGLSTHGNFTPTRLRGFATITVDPAGFLTGISEKPDDQSELTLSQRWISMNLWRFDQGIFDLAQRVPCSSRGEYELPGAVSMALAEGKRVQVLYSHAGVLDLSSPDDISTVMAVLDQRETDR